MSIVLRFILGLSLAAMTTGAVNAQSMDGLTAIPSESAFSCLSRVDGSKLPTYPAQEAVLKAGGIVRVRLTFLKADAAPKVEVSYSWGSSAFVDAAAAFVAAYRVPCMAPGAEPLLATQEFQFVPGDGRKVVYGPLRDDPKDETRTRCITGTTGQPTYPSPGFGPAAEGTVVVKLKFVDGVSPPQPTIVFDGGSSRLADSVLAFVAQYRAPCLAADGAPLTAMQLFSFVMSSSTQYALKDLPLRQFVGTVKDLDRYPARFDFSTMGCPFDVRLRLLQPHAPNQVGEVERHDPNRREFIEWLKQVSMKLPRDAARLVIGQTMTISVPCGVLDLT